MISEGIVFSLGNDAQIVSGCTISEKISVHATDFMLARGTDISPESYEKSRLWLMEKGSAIVLIGDQRISMKEGDFLVTPKKVPCGIQASEDTVYLEIMDEEEMKMNDAVKAGEVFSLKDLVPYQDGKIVNMDLVNHDKVKFVIMSFDAGTGLSEHAAPGNAIVFALDGEGIIGYEGKKYPIKAGENFRFAKMGKHSVTAEKRFKMALLLEME